MDPSAHMQQPVGGEDSSPRNYTNVSFALKSMHGRAVAGKKASVESAVSPINGIRYNYIREYGSTLCVGNPQVK